MAPVREKPAAHKPTGEHAGHAHEPRRSFFGAFVEKLHEHAQEKWHGHKGMWGLAMASDVINPFYWKNLAKSARMEARWARQDYAARLHLKAEFYPDLRQIGDNLYDKTTPSSFFLKLGRFPERHGPPDVVEDILADVFRMTSEELEMDLKLDKARNTKKFRDKYNLAELSDAQADSIIRFIKARAGLMAKQRLLFNAIVGAKGDIHLARAYQAAIIDINNHVRDLHRQLTPEFINLLNQGVMTAKAIFESKRRQEKINDFYK